MANNIPTILQSNNFAVHTFYWQEPFDKGAEEPDGPMISVGEKLGGEKVRQIANIGIEHGKIRFYSGNGFTATDRSTFYSTFLSDGNESKFVIDFQNFVKKMVHDPYSSGFLIKHASQF